MRGRALAAAIAWICRPRAEASTTSTTRAWSNVTLLLPRCSCDAACVPADRWEQHTSATANTEGAPSRRALQQSVEYKKHPSEAARQAEEQAARARAALAAQAAAAKLAAAAEAEAEAAAAAAAAAWSAGGAQRGTWESIRIKVKDFSASALAVVSAAATAAAPRV